MRKARLGKYVSDETRGKLSLKKRKDKHPLWGKHHSRSTRDKISLGNILAKASIEWREMAAALKRGKIRSRGALAPNWKGGLSSITQTFKNSLEYKDWRYKVYKRDDFTCLECQKRGGKLNVHHIIPFSMIKRYVIMFFGQEDIIAKLIKFPLTLDTSNGVTLCESCHKKTDTYLKTVSPDVANRYMRKIGLLINK